MNLTYRPLPAVWPSGERTPWNRRRRSPFSAPWLRTLELLERELANLGVSQSATVVVEAGYREADIRLDGRPRANARLEDPAVVVSFESRHGPLRYGCDAFTDHQANIRAIALALEALRAVDRYGVTKRGEQYTGWKALPEGNMASTQVEAETFIRSLVDDPSVPLATLYRRACHVAHPDHGGSRQTWDRLQAAKVALGL